jgi:hypothetical protein
MNLAPLRSFQKIISSEFAISGATMPTSKTTAAARRPAAAKSNAPSSRSVVDPDQAQAPAPAPAPVIVEGPRLIDDPHAPEFFATSCCGFSIGQGHVTLTFESARCNHFDPKSPMSRVVVGRIVLPIQAAQALVIELNTSLQRSGFNPSRAATAGMIPQ